MFKYITHFVNFANNQPKIKIEDCNIFQSLIQGSCIGCYQKLSFYLLFQGLFVELSRIPSNLKSKLISSPGFLASNISVFSHLIDPVSRLISGGISRLSGSFMLAAVITRPSAL